MLVSLANGYVTSVDFGAMVRMRRQQGLPEAVKATGTTKVFNECAFHSPAAPQPDAPWPPPQPPRPQIPSPAAKRRVRTHLSDFLVRRPLQVSHMPDLLAQVASYRLRGRQGLQSHHPRWLGAGGARRPQSRVRFHSRAAPTLSTAALGAPPLLPELSVAFTRAAGTSSRSATASRAAAGTRAATRSWSPRPTATCGASTSATSAGEIPLRGYARQRRDRARGRRRRTREGRHGAARVKPSCEPPWPTQGQGSLGRAGIQAASDRRAMRVWCISRMIVAARSNRRWMRDRMCALRAPMTCRQTIIKV